ncbi:hypothetical protein RUM44_009084 [Polyplax serrata]|uniref:Uncharacterized protein n=1 Tax=Polyplax serrata TaxID=468196 RepID=A0ABR1ARN4_POLSC
MKKNLLWQDNLRQGDTKEEYTFTGGKAGEHQESKENKRTMEAIKVENNMGSGMAERTHLSDVGLPAQIKCELSTVTI